PEALNPRTGALRCGAEPDGLCSRVALDEDDLLRGGCGAAVRGLEGDRVAVGRESAVALLGDLQRHGDAQRLSALEGDLEPHPFTFSHAPPTLPERRRWQPGGRTRSRGRGSRGG